MDVKSAIVNEDLQEVNMQQHHSFMQMGKEHLRYKMKRAHGYGGFLVTWIFNKPKLWPSRLREKIAVKENKTVIQGVVRNLEYVLPILDRHLILLRIE